MYSSVTVCYYVKKKDALKLHETLDNYAIKWRFLKHLNVFITDQETLEVNVKESVETSLRNKLKELRIAAKINLEPFSEEMFVRKRLERMKVASPEYPFFIPKPATLSEEERSTIDYHDLLPHVCTKRRHFC